MTRLFLVAGVAALAIASAAAARPGGNGGGGPHGGGNPHGQPAQQHGGGGGHGGGNRGGGGPHVQAQRGGGGGPHFQAQRGGGGPHFQAQRGGGGGPHFQMQRVQRVTMRQQRVQHGFGGMRAMQAQRQQFRGRQMRVAQSRSIRRAQSHGRQFRVAQNRTMQRQQIRANRQQMRANRMQLAQNRRFARQQLHGNAMRMAQNQALQRQRNFANPRFQQQALAGQAFNTRRFAGAARFGGNPQQYVRSQQQAYQQALAGTSFAPYYYGGGEQILAPTLAESFVGMPVGEIGGYAALGPMPASIDYLYPDGPDYYWRYGDGYAYQVDRATNLIAALIPLLAGGYLPGQYLPADYMTSYAPDYYGYNAFYPDYGDLCNRYVNGVIYRVDCDSGLVEDVVPAYAGGYGVGQMLPASYAYYNVPYQYRRLYYDTADRDYWYAPGAIYQYDPRSSMITSVAALLSPGFTVGQALPAGYDVYNVPMAYRATYFDTPNAWYRYSNGYIYQVDPVTQMVTAIVASLLT